ncbi:MAG: DUF2235 domain-containing protein [Verrucomicrobiota bacterium]
MKKRLIICCDGTWLTPANQTNVFKIYEAIETLDTTGPSPVPQIKYYDSGVGTDSPLSKLRGGAFGKGLDQNIKEAYRFLILNYEPGDELYFFGYSRGAYTVRSLAGMIYHVGLLKTEFFSHIDEAFKTYKSGKDFNEKEKVEFRESFSREINIDLVACWDTVGSRGLPDIVPFIPLDRLWNGKYQFHDTSISPIIKNALHAVAIDEKRRSFCNTPMDKGTHSPASQRVIEVWFPGGHSSVGGGTTSKDPSELDNSKLADAALTWMIETISILKLKLTFDAKKVQQALHHMDPMASFSDGLEGLFKILPKHVRRLEKSDISHVSEAAKIRWIKTRSRENEYNPQAFEIPQGIHILKALNLLLASVDNTRPASSTPRKAAKKITNKKIARKRSASAKKVTKKTIKKAVSKKPVAKKTARKTVKKTVRKRAGQRST